MFQAEWLEQFDAVAMLNCVATVISQQSQLIFMEIILWYTSPLVVVFVLKKNSQIYFCDLSSAALIEEALH